MPYWCCRSPVGDRFPARLFRSHLPGRCPLFSLNTACKILQESCYTCACWWQASPLTWHTAPPVPAAHPSAWQAVCAGAILHSLTCACALLQATRGLAGRLWAAYTRQLDVRPVLTKSLTSFTGFVVGDAIAQVSTGEKYNYWRTARFAAYGFCIHAPVCHVWYGLLDRSVMVKAPTR